MRKSNRSYGKVSDLLFIGGLLIICIAGICSFATTNSYLFTNQYGDQVQMWGTGIYAHDSYFKAPIFIGSDSTILLYAIPVYLLTLMNMRKDASIEHKIRKFGILCLLLYYTASLAFGVTYNQLHLLYITVFGLCFYKAFLLLGDLYATAIRQNIVCSYPFTRGMKVFLLLAAGSLMVAWLPDILTSLVKGTSLALIEVYTTEITYVLDMGLISPLMFLIYRLLKRGDFMGYVLFRMILSLCICIGIMLPMQSLFQLLAGISIPFMAFLSKLLIFVLMAFFAAYFQCRLKKETTYVC